jgi:hypothetical protein
MKRPQWADSGWFFGATSACPMVFLMPGHAVLDRVLQFEESLSALNNNNWRLPRETE